MVNTTLRAYLDELNLLLEQEALEEVIGHCRHILQHFPRNVETYRLLGRALLEKGRHDEAGDVFQRVLAALPDDFVSHLGLSAVAEEQGQLPNAVWHLERAFEQEPNNMALQGELQRLYEKRDGTPPGRIQMTQGALVRIYSKGRLYEQALHEADTALAQAPDRVDLQLLRADALWNSDRPLEAGEAALHVIENLPDSIDANRMLATLWLKSGRASDAAGYIARLEQLDPFLAWETVHTDGTPLPSNAFQLPRLDWDVKAAAALATDVPDWVSSISNVFESPESVSLGGANNWLEEAIPAPENGGSQSDRFDPFAARISAMEAPAPSATPAHWLDEIDEKPATSAISPMPIADEEVPDWFKDVSAPASTPAQTLAAAVPDWFDEAIGAADAVPNQPSTPEPTPSIKPQLPSGFTDLLSDISTKVGTKPPTRADVPPPPVTEIPDWMNDVIGQQHDEQSSGNVKPLPKDDMPDWMNDVVPAGKSQEEAASLDAMSWLNTGPLPSLDDVVPPARSAMPANQVEESPLDRMDWLNTSTLPPLDQAMSARSAAAPEEQSVENLFETVGWQNTGSLPPLDQAVDAHTPQDDDLFETVGWQNTGSLPPLDQAVAGSDAEQPDSAKTLDAMSWLNTGPLRPLDQVLPPSASDNVAEAPAEALDAMSWLNTGPLRPLDQVLAAAIPESEEASDDAGDGMDWLQSMGADAFPPDPEPAETATSQQPGDLELFDLGQNFAEMPAAETAETGSVPDWMKSLSDVPAAQTEDLPVAEADAQSGLDWMNGVNFENVAPELALDEEVEETAQPAENIPDWMNSLSTLPSAEAQNASKEAEFADETSDVSSGGLDWLSSNSFESALPAVQSDEHEAAPAQDRLDWLGSLSSANISDQPVEELEAETETEADIEPAENIPDWMGSLSAPVAAQVDPASTGNRLDWLGSSDSLDSVLPAAQPEGATVEPTDSGLDWLGGLPSPEQEQPAVPRRGVTDWLSNLPAAAPAETEQAPADAELPELAEPPGLAEQPVDSAMDGGLDWLGSASFESDAPADEAETTAAPAQEAGLDWLGSLSAPVLTETAGGDDETEMAEPAVDSGLDWLGSMPAPEEKTPDVPRRGVTDWLSGLPATDATETETEKTEESETEFAIPSASSDLDWLGGASIQNTESVSAINDLPADQAEAAEEESDVDWFSNLDNVPGMPAAAEQDEAPVEAAANVSGLDWLSTMPAADLPGSAAQDVSTLDWASESGIAEEPAAEVINDGDPLAWLRPYQGPDGLREQAIAEESADSDSGLAPMDDEPLVQLDDMPALQALEDASAEATIPAKFPWMVDDAVPAEPEPAALESSDDWLSNLGTPASKNAATDLDWMAQSANQAATPNEQPVEMEDEWLASFESPASISAAKTTNFDNVPPIAVDKPDAGLGISSEQEPDAGETSGGAWFSALAVNKSNPDSSASSASDWLGSLSTTPSAMRDTSMSGSGTTDAESVEESPADDWFASIGGAPKAANASPDEESPGPWMSASSDFAQAQDDEKSSQAEAGTPDWLKSGSPQAAQAQERESFSDRVTGLLAQAGNRSANTISSSQTGILDPDSVPDWLSVLGGSSGETPTPTSEEAPASAAAPEFDFDAYGESLSVQPPAVSAGTSVNAAADSLAFESIGDSSAGLGDDAAMATEDVPDWLSQMAPPASANDPTRAGAAAPRSLDELDFGSLDAAPATASVQPAPKADDFDFGNLFEEPAASPATSAPHVKEVPSGGSGMAEFDAFAQPANLVNTSGNQGGQARRVSPAFRFDRPPAWLRKKRDAKQSASRNTADDLPDWLSGNSSGASDSNKDDVPDWLK